jgi:copper chaperone
MAAMETTTIHAPEIHCDHCKTSIEGAVGPLEGVERAEVDVAAREVSVTYDPARIDRGAIVATIEEQGFEVAPG